MGPPAASYVPRVSSRNGEHSSTHSKHHEFTTAAVYGFLDHEGVTAWLDLRNNVVHCKYGQEEKVQVALNGPVRPGLLHAGIPADQRRVWTSACSQYRAQMRELTRRRHRVDSSHGIDDIVAGMARTGYAQRYSSKCRRETATRWAALASHWPSAALLQGGSTARCPSDGPEALTVVRVRRWPASRITGVDRW